MKTLARKTAANPNFPKNPPKTKQKPQNENNVLNTAFTANDYTMIKILDLTAEQTRKSFVPYDLTV